MKYRGVVYDVGLHFSPETPSVDPFNPDLVAHDLRVIADDLHANAVRIEGESIPRLVATARAAHAVGLSVFFNPWKMHAADDIVRAYLAEAAKAAEDLRGEGLDIVFVAQCEYTLFNEGIIPGATLMERVKCLGEHLGKAVGGARPPDGLREASERLNKVLGSFLQEIRPVFHGRVTYSAGTWEAVDWTLFDLVGVDHYRQGENESEYLAGLERYRCDKPLAVMEFGCCAYEGAAALGAGGFMLLEGSNPDGTGNFAGGFVPRYSETEQADYIDTLVRLLAGASVDAAFVYVFSFPTYRAGEGARNLDMMSFSLVKTWPEADERSKMMPPWEAKESF
ncbi:abortive infection protein [Colletotrichum tofieldiae]|uniref:Abortive infection protein n=1 Tax=Colletotrichum tofieldiae TaxID=708197 RepID=A0A166V1K9_9PEZI|nr:abortive infection protein [Colletotrichum tofieldiae]GKT61674.1 abortive infection protein [Colletotrichum tofieldiae]GKT70272.1 abortive infection protein [Colletotrichum tofieldiae]GKT93326.1 abortive infection protein [Colletotrichum tofieldiae]